MKGAKSVLQERDLFVTHLKRCVTKGIGPVINCYEFGLYESISTRLEHYQKNITKVGNSLSLTTVNLYADLSNTF